MTRCRLPRTPFPSPRDSAPRAGGRRIAAPCTTDLDEARGHHALLRQLVERHSGAASDFRALRRVLELCRRAAEAIDDRYCRDKLRLVEDFAAEMFSHSEHDKWQRESMSGAEFLKAADPRARSSCSTAGCTASRCCAAPRRAPASPGSSAADLKPKR